MWVLYVYALLGLVVGLRETNGVVDVVFLSLVVTLVPPSVMHCHGNVW